MTRLILTACVCLIAALPAAAAQGDSEAARVRELADAYYEMQLNAHPELVIILGLESEDRGGISSNRQSVLARRQHDERMLLDSLRQVDQNALRGRVEWITYGILEQSMRSSQDLWVCRHDLWNINHMSGWQMMFPRIMELHPIGEDEVRLRALVRMSDMVLYIRREIAKLKEGLEKGYSAPKSVVRRVIQQVEGILALDRRKQPLISPIWRDDSNGFLQQGLYFYMDDIIPTWQAYRDFLADEYLPRARESLSVTANPNGRLCYEASLRYYTTLQRTPEEVYQLGRDTVEANRIRVQTLGKAAYGLDDFASIMARIRDDEDDKFDDAAQMLDFSRNAVARAGAVMPNWFGTVPAQAVAVEPYPDYQEGSGVSSRYEAGTGERPGVYRISRHEPEKQSKGNAESTAFHEAWPGHHLQISAAQKIEGLHPISRISFYSGMSEGWARYSESLAHEMGLYETATGPIARLAWPARGMVVDPGIHIMNWTREQAIAFMAEAGRMTPGELDDMVDRIAILPGQLTAYDSGGLEILALRKLAETRLGAQFDIKDFHDRVLENGSVPLTVLRAHIENWLEAADLP